MQVPFAAHLVPMELTYRLIDGGTAPGPATADAFIHAWPAYRRWFLNQGEQARPTYAESRAALKRWMPELLDDYDALVASVGGGDLEARFLSHWCPPPLVAACSIAMATAPEPFLIRTYDYPPSLCSLVALRTWWSGTGLLGMMDCAWGLTDGINADGLALAISFGGRRPVGEGFGIGLVVRCLLQSCSTVAEAIARARALPVQMSYNVAALDASGEHAVIRLAPDRPAEAMTDLSCANRQGDTEWPAHAEYSGTAVREQVLASLVTSGAGPAALTAAFQQAPLARPLSESTWGTVFTASYSPASRSMALHWPEETWTISVLDTSEGSRTRWAEVLYPEPLQLHAPAIQPVPIPILR